MRTYEIMFILRSDLPQEESDRLISQLESVATSTGGPLRKVDRMGRRRLAYPVAKERDGYYVLFVVDCEAPTVQELERRLKVAEPVLKHLTVRVDEEMKQMEKREQLRTQRQARKKPKPGAETAASPA